MSDATQSGEGLSGFERRLAQRLETIKGVGDKTAELLAAAGLETIGDLIYFLPRKHQDFSEVSSVAALEPGTVSVRGAITGATTRKVRRGLSVTEATLSDTSGKVALIWFNQPYRATQLVKGKEWLVSGEFGLQGKRYQIVNPSVEDAHEPSVQGARLLPIYREVRGLKSNLVRKLVVELRPLMSMLPETLPREVVAKYGLISHSDAVMGMHFPDSMEKVQAARERLGFGPNT